MSFAMENKIQALPPLKRFRFMLQNQHHNESNPIISSSFSLPAKKRKESRDLNPAPITTLSLPGKKRVWAFQPDLVNPDEPFLNLDLNAPPPNEEKLPYPYKPVDSSIQISKIIGESEEEEDDGIECAVCKSTDGDPTDPIVFCDGCNLMVHTTCYGSPLINGIPDGDWFCAQCCNKQMSPVSCCLCPIKGGAMKPTTVDGKWAHLVCSLFVPEVFFTDPVGREGIDCSKVPKRRWEKNCRCYLCGSSSGCAIECSEPRCELAFHVTCGLNEELCIEYKEGINNGGVVGAFCKDHTKLWEEKTGKFKIVAREK
ncbi:protein Jade-1 isoform X2 [Impatiens glandulifera]|uniref:protein Jade-1 isoform X2 n=1 Tax=Impatiens glandulifera TaxID=253017 RepID=UPI001FB08240|nr:protein Jade-1 isoform X2 [Impatiens glandulifera]